MICSNLQCFVRKNTVLSPHDLAFQLIKSKKNYKAKFSTNLILKKKKPTKIILEKTKEKINAKKRKNRKVEKKK